MKPEKFINLLVFLVATGMWYLRQCRLEAHGCKSFNRSFLYVSLS